MQNRNRKIIRRAALQLFLFPESAVTRHITDKLALPSHFHDALCVSLLAFPTTVRPWIGHYLPPAIDARMSLGQNSPLCIQGRI